MLYNLRKSPLICLIISIFKLIFRRLKLPKQYVNSTIRMENGCNYTIFRHISTKTTHSSYSGVVFIVSFKFSRLTHKANKVASILPMLLIAGFPGFVKKIYAVNHENGYWQGMYQWTSLESLEEYKKSFVFRIMNKRAKHETIFSMQFENRDLDSYIRERKI